MRELVLRWCHSGKTFALLRSSVEFVAVSTAASESEAHVCPHLACMDHGLKRVTAHEKGREKGKGKGKRKKAQTNEGTKELRKKEKKKEKEKCV